MQLQKQFYVGHFNTIFHKYPSKTIKVHEKTTLSSIKAVKTQEKLVKIFSLE